MQKARRATRIQLRKNPRQPRVACLDIYYQWNAIEYTLWERSVLSTDRLDNSAADNRFFVLWEFRREIASILKAHRKRPNGTENFVPIHYQPKLSRSGTDAWWGKPHGATPACGMRPPEPNCDDKLRKQEDENTFCTVSGVPNIGEATESGAQLSVTHSGRAGVHVLNA